MSAAPESARRARAGFTRIPHQTSAHSPDLHASSALRSLGVLDDLFKVASALLGREHVFPPRQGPIRPASPPNAPKSGERSGFTLIEVVLAMGILVMGAAAVLGMLTFGAALTRTAQLRAAAAQAVDAVNADLDQVLFPYADGEVGEPVAIEAREVPGAPDVVYSASATQNPDDAREYRVDVEMSWKSAGVKRSRSYSILRMREISFGERLRRELVEGGGLRRSAPAIPGGEGNER